MKENKSGTQTKLYIDGESIGVISLETVVRYELKVGMEINADELTGYIRESQVRIGFDWLINYMGAFPCSRVKAKRKLLEKSYHVVAIDEIIAKAEEYGYLNDYNFAENYVASNIANMSKRQMRDKLSQLGIPSAIIQETLLQFDEDEELDAACTVARRWSAYKDTEDYKFREKFSRYMMAKGYGWDIISKAYAWLREELKDEAENI